MLITLLVVYIARRIRAARALRSATLVLQITQQSNLNVK